MEQKHIKNYGTTYFAIALIIAVFFELYFILTDPYNYFMLLGIMFVIIITGYLTFDSIDKSRKDAAKRLEEQNDILIKANKAIYLATKRNSQEAEKQHVQNIKAIELMMNKMISNEKEMVNFMITKNEEIAAKQIESKQDPNANDMTALIDQLSASNAKLAKEVQSAITVNELVKANADLVKNVREVLQGTNNASANADINMSNLASYVSSAITPMAEPVMQPMTQPVMQPMTQPVMQPMSQPVMQPMSQPVMQPIAQPVMQPMAEPVMEPVAEPVMEPVVQPIMEPVAEPVMEPVAEPVMEPVAEPVIEPLAEPVMEPVAEPIMEEIPNETDEVNMDDLNSLITELSTEDIELPQAEEEIDIESFEIPDTAEDVNIKEADAASTEDIINDVNMSTLSEMVDLEGDTIAPPVSEELDVMMSTDNSSPLQGLDDNPNRQLTEEEIAALFANL